MADETPILSETPPLALHVSNEPGRSIESLMIFSQASSAFSTGVGALASAGSIRSRDPRFVVFYETTP